MPFKSHRKSRDAGRLLRLGFFFLSVELVALDEAINATFRVNDLLLTGVEGVAVAADFNPDLLLGRPELHLIAADTGGYNVKVLGMNSFFHNSVPINWRTNQPSYQRLAPG